VSDQFDRADQSPPPACQKCFISRHFNSGVPANTAREFRRVSGKVYFDTACERKAFTFRNNTA
jgi:hypothetical protein